MPVLFLFLFGKRTNRDNWENRLLIINLEALGDLVIFTSVLKYYKKRFPDKKIYLLIKKGFGAEKIFAGNFADEVLILDYQRFSRNPFYGVKFINSLRRIGFAKVINHDHNAAEIQGKIIAVETGAKETLAYRGTSFEWEIPFDVQQKNNLRIVARKIFPRYTRIIPGIGRNPSSIRYPSAINHYSAIYKAATGFKESDYSTTLGNLGGVREDILKKFGVEKGRYAVIVPGASVKFRRWPLKNFVKLAEFLHKKGLSIAITGSPAEAGIAENFASLSDFPIINLIGKTNFIEFVEIIRSSRLVVTNDTSSVHLAVALKVPSLCIVGGGNFGMFSDYGYEDINRWVYEKSPCFGDNWRCGASLRDGMSPCVAAVKLEKVLEELENLLEYINGTDNIPQKSFGVWDH